MRCFYSELPDFFVLPKKVNFTQTEAPACRHRGMKLKNVLSLMATEADFFEGMAFIGISSAYVGHHLCYMLNKHLDMEFVRGADEVEIKKPDGMVYFPFYVYCPAGSADVYRLYGLRSGNVPLLPEFKRIEYLMTITSDNAPREVQDRIPEVARVPGITHCFEIDEAEIKTRNHLIV